MAESIGVLLGSMGSSTKLVGRLGGHLALLKYFLLKRGSVFYRGIWRVEHGCWLLLDNPLHRECCIVFIQVKVVECLLCKKGWEYIGELHESITLLRVNCHVLDLSENFEDLISS